MSVSTPRARILVIDDEAMIGSAIRRAIGRHHDVTAVTTGREAIDRFAAGERYDVVLCDLMMPDLTGMDLFDAVSQRWPELIDSFIFLSGGAFTDRARSFLEHVPNKRMDKPFNRDELLQEVSRRLQPQH